MIINGGSRSNGEFFAKHLTDGENNERVTLCEMRNLIATTIPDAFREMEAVALATFCRNYFYHANVNPRQDELLSAEQWQIAVDTLEQQLGLKGNARFVVEHFKVGRTHRHVIWSRIDVNAMRAIPMTDDYEKHQRVSRELEKAFGLKPERSVFGKDRVAGERPSRRPKTWESFRGQKSGLDVRQLTKAITGLYLSSSSGTEFALLLARNGCVLVKGDRSDFCIRDAAGHLHSLLRRIEGITAGQLHAFMKDVDPAALPRASSARLSADT
jgi:hypothetical protein